MYRHHNPGNFREQAKSSEPSDTVKAMITLRQMIWALAYSVGFRANQDGVWSWADAEAHIRKNLTHGCACCGEPCPVTQELCSECKAAKVPEPTERVTCQQCGASYEAEWAGTTCSVCDGDIA